MASKVLIDTALKLYQGLGGNVSKILGTRSNVSFLGKGKSSELMVDMDVNPEALAILPQSKAVEELTSAMGYLTSGKLNDLQAGQLIKNMQKMDELYNPPAAPANITDMVTGTRGLNKEGLESLRAMADDLPPPGSRGGADDIAAPFTGEGLESLKKVQNFDRTIGDDLVNRVYDMAGVKEAAKPVARGNARDFLNTIKDMEDPTFPDGPTLSSVMELDDLKFMTEGGGGALGDPLLLVQKYFGPRVASAVSQLDGREQIETFAKNLVRIKDAKGRTITDRNFDPRMVDPEDFEFADGGRVPFSKGKIVKGGLQGLAQLLKKEQARTKRISGNLRLENMQRTEIGKPKKGVDYDYYRELLDDDENFIVMGDETEDFLKAMVKEQEAEMAYMKRLYDKGALNPTAGETTMGRLRMLEDKAQSGEVLSADEIAEIKRLSEIFNKADGGRVPFFRGRLVGKALGLAKKAATKASGKQMGYGDIRKYGLEAEDISRLFRNVAMDKSLVGKEKTLYMKQLNQVLRNPDDYPEGIREIQQLLGIDPIGFKGGGLAEILEV